MSGESRSSENEDFQPPGKEGLSQFLTRLLDQLSLSAWFPAAILVALMLLIGSIRAAGGDIGEAFESIATMRISAVVLLIGAIVITTVLTQAFQFEAIQFLEGYWRPGTTRDRLAGILIGRHQRRRARLEKRAAELAERAFAEAQLAMLEKGISPVVVQLVAERRRSAAARTAGTAKDRALAGQLIWERFVPPAEARRLSGVRRLKDGYPDFESDVQPTRFGNLLRAYEGRLQEKGIITVERFVQQTMHLLPTTLRAQHDQFRSRLDLYCSLIVVLVISGLVAVGTFATLDWPLLVVTACLSLVLVIICYRAAIASVRGYGTVLMTMAEHAASQAADEKGGRLT